MITAKEAFEKSLDLDEINKVEALIMNAVENKRQLVGIDNLKPSTVIFLRNHGYHVSHTFDEIGYWIDFCKSL